MIAHYQAVHDPQGMEQYAKAAMPVLAEHGGRVIVAETAASVVEGDAWTSAQLVVIEFDSVDAARTWYDSPGYQAARAFRQASAECEVMIVSGFEPPQASKVFRSPGRPC
ncbi:DUF1330 domain-containing protein [Nocardioides sp. cx-173]|uniref:DUF1330 domain-containing protein n=1 Tax=Nocardioides sp. cx-173 TaxID=2898796 RepID=UPI001E547195|nr:DUF1330 domain-containing protein [Nocardioides sp. cx-173]UGB41617.1 DUF1330 domain-containing protein [Nocardioides sp. cx-173]